MLNKYKLKTVIATSLYCLVFALLLAIPSRVQVSAQSIKCTDGTVVQGSLANLERGDPCEDHYDAATTCTKMPLRSDADCPFLSKYVVPAINVLSGVVGIVVVIMIVWGGIQYSQSRDNPQQTAQAKDHIRNALLALVIYIFMIAFLSWAVPGGVFSP